MKIEEISIMDKVYFVDYKYPVKVESIDYKEQRLTLIYELFKDDGENCQFYKKTNRHISELSPTFVSNYTY